MKRLLIIFIAACLLFAGCMLQSEDMREEAFQEETAEEHIIIEDSQQQDDAEHENIEYNEDALNQTLNDWMLGTDYGIEAVEFDGKNVQIVISDENYAKFEHYDFDDIVTGIVDILSYYDLRGDYMLTYSNGDTTEFNVGEYHEDEQTEQTDTEDEVFNHSEPVVYNDGDTINLIFIHHSVGENWLNAGLNEMLNNNNVHVADTYYGWGHMGDRTDTVDWPHWFNDDVMPTVYNEMDTMTAYNAIEPASGENTIIMFKSCYPNSEVGSGIEDEKQIYLSLLDYFSNHPDKMFVLITPSPMQHISNPSKTRELCNWLVDENGWRKEYIENNLYVFDFYNVLTAEDNHHMLVDAAEQHIINNGSNTLHYDSWGDDHPNDDGSYKASEEFVPLLMYWYNEFIGQ